MKDITIRRPGIEELERIHAFFEEVLVDTFKKNNIYDRKELLQEEILDKKRGIAQDFDTEGKERFFLLAEHKGEIIGSIEYGLSNDLLNSCTEGELKDMLEIGTVYVRPDWQKRGVSALLMHSLFEVLKEKQVEEICFDSGYKIAQSIWCKRFGNPAYYLENYWGEGAHHMVWRVKIEEAIERLIPKRDEKPSKILLLCAKGFETMEFSVFIDILGWAREEYGHDISVETCGFTVTVLSTFGVPVIMDRLIEEIQTEEYDALAIPGGFERFGFYEEAYDERTLNLIRDFDRQGKIIASVCVGALSLGKSGILKNKRATTYHLQGGRQKQLAEFGATVVNEPVVVDGNIITSYCPETAPYVAFELLKKLVGEEDMLVVKRAMGY